MVSEQMKKNVFSSPSACTSIGVNFGIIYVNKQMKTLLSQNLNESKHALIPNQFDQKNSNL